MSTDLLNPRYKLIADYPDSRMDVGDILHKYVFPKTDNYVYVTNQEAIILSKHKNKNEVEKYPHLFRRLSWWEDREEKEMPEYVKILTGGKIMLVSKIRYWEGNRACTFNTKHHLWIDVSNGQENACEYLPATLDEYNQYNQQKK